MSAFIWFFSFFHASFHVKFGYMRCCDFSINNPQNTCLVTWLLTWNITFWVKYSHIVRNWKWMSKNPGRFQFHFSGVLEACLMLKNSRFFANLDLKLTFVCFQHQLFSPCIVLNNWSWKQPNVSFKAFLMGNQP